MRAQFGGMSIDVKDGWADTTEDLSVDNAPWTLTREASNASGALQFTVALYKGGRLPLTNAGDLSEFLMKFAKACELGAPSDLDRQDKPISVAAATFFKDGDFIRVWFVSDGASIVQATYLSLASADYTFELAECEAMIQTIEFRYAERAN